MLFYYLSICVLYVSACEQHQTCRACIRDSGSCVWCANESITGPRCISKKSTSENWCSDELKDPRSIQHELPHQLEFSSSPEQIVQIIPQRISMELRPGQSLKFNFSYTAADQYPVDIYFLYDASLKHDVWKDQVNQTKSLIQSIQTNTSNVYIGLGTFVNKNMLPFTRIRNETLAHSFNHLFSLSKDQAAFEKAINGVQLISSVSNENMNGGFDALAQVIACQDIGWRNVSRKIVVFLSNKTIHSAGDSRSAGVINPYDGRCHLKNGKYTEEVKMDYPSPSIINKLAMDRAVTIIFVADTNILAKYKSLRNTITDAHIISFKPTMSYQDTFFSKLTKIYEGITETLKLRVNISPKYAKQINLIYEPNCDKIQCKLKQKEVKKFIGTITVEEFFEADNIKVTISVKGIKEELTLDIKLIDECKCSPGNRSLCNDGGTPQCGVCECDVNRSGLNCECSSEDNNKNNDKSTCVMPKSNDTIECNGRGSCICGSCSCGEKRYKGRYCECDNESCPKDGESRLCGNGNCQCGQCNCNMGWSKDSRGICNCDTSKDQCLTGDIECSSYGNCECNECKCPLPICDWDARSDQGPKCNPMHCSDDCNRRQCHLLEPYALGRIKINTDCERRVTVTSVKSLENGTTWLCSDVRSDVGCYTNFTYRYDSESYGVHLIIQSEYNCAESAYIYGGACLGGLLLLGILTLVGWKVATMYRDRKEYKQFLSQYQESLATSAQQENPIFSSPNKTIENPNYRRRSRFY